MNCEVPFPTDTDFQDTIEFELMTCIWRFKCDEDLNGQRLTCRRRMTRGRTVRWSACMSPERLVREKWDCSRAFAFVWGSVHLPFSTAMWACIKSRRTVSSSPSTGKNSSETLTYAFQHVPRDVVRVRDN